MRKIHVSKGAMLAAAAVWVVSIAVSVSAQAVKNPEAAKLKNPTKATPESLTAGAASYKKYCEFCHGVTGDGKGKIIPKGTTPANLVDDTWDHGATDGEIFTSIKEGIGPKFEMKAMKTKITDPDIWNVVNYVRSLKAK